jgi:hypothetical protein
MSIEVPLWFAVPFWVALAILGYLAGGFPL